MGIKKLNKVLTLYNGCLTIYTTNTAYLFNIFLVGLVGGSSSQT